MNDEKYRDINVVNKKLTFEELLLLSKEKFKVPIASLGYVVVRRPTSADQAIAMAQSDNGKNPLEYQNTLIAHCLVDPKLDPVQVAQLPSGVATIILKALSDLMNPGNSDFLKV